MLNKDLIKRNFSKCLDSYNENAVVQSYMAKRLVKLIKEKCGNNFDKVLEIGAGTGLLTASLVSGINTRKYYANDMIVGYQEYVRDIFPEANFIDGDFENINLEERFDLILANAVFQWIEQKEIFLKKISDALNNNSFFVFTTFGKNNFAEICDVFGVSLPYLSIEELGEMVADYFKFIYIEQQKKQLLFDDIYSLLLHFKKTGTNNLSSEKLSKKKLLVKEKAYRHRHSLEDKLTLSYEPIWVICSKL